MKCLGAPGCLSTTSAVHVTAVPIKPPNRLLSTDRPIVLQVIIMEYRGAGLSKNLSEEPWSYYNQARYLQGGQKGHDFFAVVTDW